MNIVEIAPKNYLYHGTLKENVRGIMRDGLRPQHGNFVQAVYGDSIKKKKRYVFAVELDDISDAVFAIVNQIAIKYDYDFENRMTLDDFYRYGCLLALRKTGFKKARSANQPSPIEYTNYYSSGIIKRLYVLKDDELATFLEDTLDYDVINMAPDFFE